MPTEMSGKETSATQFYIKKDSEKQTENRLRMICLIFLFNNIKRN